ncbi:MAG: DUF167 domain-containing protein [Epsilonproteobacteria bacterium]|nr:DUF167 domain-containing protein [Campylobacterota bacterium]OIO13835.1 MAG: hypothetical protein AUJ81_10690 [Helicobacteraceae bacterium CG1_02_36_14]PIP11484.1 MAG: hypothetical protein COX50_00420 [Sulfurimonas sp. CG23_combo_of_CG06-09_8_20_14_all_36_33]PIS25103.1 MAG: hypothetical protein COT46_07140 [Sulfurimonas sp. CG08_land_8_20_14_0_20_36_33]PIU34644.1 MAG: hypothetical protein COT05_06755 [Sulfurimonas sp. CG07_land_8_20_14_0_80_36_56]PIV04132.1 MAG: hypothetical protein COS56_0
MAKKRKLQEDKEVKEQRLQEFKDKNTWFWWEGDVLVFNILGNPSAKQTKIGKPFGNQLKISVACAPVNGKATDHLVKFLATEFGVKVKDIEVVFGRMNVNKQLRVTAPQKLPSVFK